MQGALITVKLMVEYITVGYFVLHSQKPLIRQRRRPCMRTTVSWTKKPVRHQPSKAHRAKEVQPA
jgi:hypothetical protein